jgi:hypothetical protein
MFLVASRFFNYSSFQKRFQMLFHMLLDSFRYFMIFLLAIPAIPLKTLVIHGPTVQLQRLWAKRMRSGTMELEMVLLVS